MKTIKLAQNGSPDLGQKHGARRDFQVLTHLQITSQINGRADNIVAPHRKLCDFNQMYIVANVSLTYRFATGFPGFTAPATIFINWLVAMPFPILANSNVEKG
jgi:hypothetical protein